MLVRSSGGQNILVLEQEQHEEKRILGVGMERQNRVVCITGEQWSWDLS